MRNLSKWVLAVCLLLPFSAQGATGTFPPVEQGLFTDYSTAVLGGSALQVVAQNNSRKYLVIQNPGTENVACSYNSSVAVGGVGSIILTQYGSWSFSGNFVYSGAVWCVAATGSNNTLVVLEGN